MTIVQSRYSERRFEGECHSVQRRLTRYRRAGVFVLSNILVIPKQNRYILVMTPPPTLYLPGTNSRTTHGQGAASGQPFLFPLTWCNRPSGENVVVLLSYLRAILERALLPIPGSLNGSLGAGWQYSSRQLLLPPAVLYGIDFLRATRPGPALF